MLKRFLSFAAVAMLALVVLAACGDDDEEAEDITRVPDAANAPTYATPAAAAEGTPTDGPDVAQATPAPDGDGGGGEGVTVVSLDIKFDPAQFSVPADTEVAVSLPNEGALPHNFSIDQLGIDVDIDPGDTQETTLTAPAGQYEYYCNVPGHKAAGMVGTLTAE